MVPVELYSPSKQVCKAGAGTVTGRCSLGRTIAIPHWLSDWKEQMDWEQAADHNAASAQLKGVKLSSGVNV